MSSTPSGGLLRRTNAEAEADHPGRRCYMVHMGVAHNKWKQDAIVAVRRVAGITVSSSDFSRCPQQILVPDHYRGDGTCSCPIAATDGTWLVPSASTAGVYWRVFFVETTNGPRIRCTCPHGRESGPMDALVNCRHVRAVAETITAMVSR